MKQRIFIGAALALAVYVIVGKHLIHQADLELEAAKERLRQAKENLAAAKREHEDALQEQATEQAAQTARIDELRDRLEAASTPEERDVVLAEVEAMMIKLTKSFGETA